MAVQLEDLIRQGVFDIELNVNDPRTTGFSAGDGAMGKAIDGTRWVKIGPNDTDWEQLLITTDGSFAANIELADVTLVTPPQNVLGVKDGTLTLGDGSTQGGVEVIGSGGRLPQTFWSRGNDNNEEATTYMRNFVDIPTNITTGYSNIVSFSIGSRVKTIEASAFEKLIFIEDDDLIIPDNVESIGESAFEGSTGFNGSIIITKNPNYTTIVYKTFRNLSTLTGDLTIPDNVTTIEAQAFDGTYCGNLTLSNNLTSIGQAAFYTATITGDLVIPDSVETIASSAFQNCTFGGSLTLSTNPLFTNIDFTAFGNMTITGDLIIPPNITYIGGGAFSALDVDTLTINGLDNGLDSTSFQGTANRVEILETSSSASYDFRNLTITDGQIHVPVGATGYLSDYNGNTVVYDL